MTCLFGLLVVDTDDIIPACSCKVSAIVGVVNRENLIIRLDSMPELFACLGEDLEDVPIRIGSQQDGPHGL